MKQLKCQHCGASIHWDGYSKIVKCDFCDAEYEMHPESNRGNSHTGMPQYGDGTVIPMTMNGDEIIKNRFFMEAYVPSGFLITVKAADRWDMIGTPFVPCFFLESPDHKTTIAFVGTAKYKHIDPGMMTQHLQEKVDFGPINPLNPSYFRLKSYMNARDYCDSILQKCPEISNIQLYDEKQPDEKERNKHQQIITERSQAGFAEIIPEWIRRYYNCTSSTGEPMKAVVETRIVLNKIKSFANMSDHMRSLGRKGESLFGGKLGSFVNKMADTVAERSEQKIWEVQYELFLVCPASELDTMLKEFEKVDETTQYLPDIEQINAELNQFVETQKISAANAVNNAQMQMAQDRAASWERRSAIIQDTN
nr:hypothetical protein [Lachnospiraceae bacterium]